MCAQSSAHSCVQGCAAMSGTGTFAAAPRTIHCPGNTFVIRVRLAKGRVDQAWSTGRMTRNMNVLLQGGLDAAGRPQFAQQAHCLCNDGHALAAIRALEDLAGVIPPRGALLVRGVVQALRGIQEHLLHVYQFHLSDWASLEAALRADPARAARLADAEGRDAAYYRLAGERLRSLAGEQGADVFGADPGGHPEVRGEDELHLVLYAHGLEALRAGALINAALGLLQCGPEGFKAYQLGGLPGDMDLGGAVRDRLRELLMECCDFVRRTFLPDLERLALANARWAALGAGSAFLACGDFPGSPKGGPLFPGGIAVPSDGDGEDWGWALGPLRSEKIREAAEPDWRAEDRDRYRLIPGDGDPAFTWGQGDFFWLPAPRHGKEACEAGPLARVLAGWARGSDPVRRVVNQTLDVCGLTPRDLNSTLGRVLSRGVESVILAESALDRLDELDRLLDLGRGPLCIDPILPSQGLGSGWVEVPRGALNHSIRFENGRITAHDYLIPSLWNFSPRDADGEPGPLERALKGTPVADPTRPLEILRTVHELDPCNACHLVVHDLDTGRTTLANAK